LEFGNGKIREKFEKAVPSSFFPFFYNKLSSVIHLYTKQYSEAIADFGKAMYVHPNRCDIYYWEGKLYRETKNIQKSIQKFKQAMHCQGLEHEKANIAGVHELYAILKEEKNLGDTRDLEEELMLRVNVLGIKVGE